MKLAMSALVLAFVSLFSSQAVANDWFSHHTSLTTGSNLLLNGDVGGVQTEEVMVTGTSSGSTIDGLHEGFLNFVGGDTDAVASVGGHPIRFYNEGSNNVTVVHHSSATGIDSTNWIKTWSGHDVILQPGEWMTIVAVIDHDLVNNVWTYQGWMQVIDRDVYIAQPAIQPSRSFGTAWQPNAARATNVVISLSATCTLTLSGGSAGHLDVLVGSTNSPTTVIGSIPCANTGTVVVGVNSTITTGGVVSYTVRPGDWVKVTTINTTGTPTYTLAVTEEPL